MAFKPTIYQNSNIFGKVLKSLIIKVDFASEITVFLADIGYLVKLLSIH